MFVLLSALVWQKEVVYNWVDTTIERGDLVVADFDGDGDLDFAVVSGRPDWPGRGVSVYLQNSLDSWTERLISSSTSDYDDWYIDQGDVNGDGRPDFITAWPKVYLNQGSAVFQEVQLANWGHSLSYRFRGGAAFGDLDLDGNLDAVVQVGSENMLVPVVAIFWNDGSGNFSPPETLDTSHRAYISSLRVVDFNGDSCPDIVANGGDEVAIYWCAPLEREEGPYHQRPRLAVEPGQLVLTLPRGEEVRVYDAVGGLIHAQRHPQGVFRIGVKPGVYLVKLGKRTLKAAVP